MSPLPENRWLLLDVPHQGAWGWTRTPRPTPRLQIRSLSGQPWVVHLEGREPGVRAFQPGLDVPRGVALDLALAVALDRRMIEEHWLDDCIDTWDWLTISINDNQVLVTIYEGTDREFTRVVPVQQHALQGDLVVEGIEVLTRKPRLVIRTNIGELVIHLVDVVLVDAPVAPPGGRREGP